MRRLNDGSSRCERPLVVRCGALGDMVLVTALIRCLSARFGRYVDVLTSGPWSEPLLRGQSGVGDILCVRSRKTPYWLSIDQRRAVRRLRERGVGPTWYCDGNDAARPMLERAGIGEPFIVDVKDHPLLAGEHATQQWRRLARTLPAALGGAAQNAEVAGMDFAAGEGCYLDVGDWQRADLAAWLRVRRLEGRPFIAVQMGNKRTMRRGLRRLAVNSKYWPEARWVEVLQHVRRRNPRHAVILLGTGPEYGLNQQVAALAGIEGLYNVADDMPVTRLVALLARADALISVDSGPAHAAAAVGCPQVVLFGKASTSLYRPWGRAGADVSVLTGRIGGEPSMLGIEAAEVIAAWDKLRLRTD
ncbi:MAG: glycosyltransferase family 9 protein [Pseudomonadota bacterium]|nr:glycosyltransferase family 9 protein [Pseudomonadota bacterium]